MDRDEVKQWYSDAVESLVDLGYDARVREDYSGRGMMGDTIPAIVTDAPPVVLGWALTCLLPEEDKDKVGLIPTCVDSMGRDYIYY